MSSDWKLIFSSIQIIFFAYKIYVFALFAYLFCLLQQKNAFVTFFILKILSFGKYLNFLFISLDIADQF